MNNKHKIKPKVSWKNIEREKDMQGDFIRKMGAEIISRTQSSSATGPKSSNFSLANNKYNRNLHGARIQQKQRRKTNKNQNKSKYITSSKNSKTVINIPCPQKTKAFIYQFYNNKEFVLTWRFVAVTFSAGIRISRVGPLLELSPFSSILDCDDSYFHHNFSSSCMLSPTL